MPNAAVARSSIRRRCPRTMLLARYMLPMPRHVARRRPRCRYATRHARRRLFARHVARSAMFAPSHIHPPASSRLHHAGLSRCHASDIQVQQAADIVCLPPLPPFLLRLLDMTPPLRERAQDIRHEMPCRHDGAARESAMRKQHG